MFTREVGQRPRHGAAYQIAEAYAWRGEIDCAFEWIERPYVQRDPDLSNTTTDPWFPSLRGDPRWLPFVQKRGLV